jgi:hypothetical protein
MKYYISKKKMILGWFGSIVFVGLGFLLLAMPDLFAKFIGLVSICFFGPGIIAIPLRTFRSDQYVEINDEGIIDQRTSLGLILWKDIRKLWVEERTARYSVPTSRILCIELVNPAAYISRLSILSKILIKVNSSMPITLSFSSLTTSFDDILDYIKSKHPEKFR